MPPVDPRRVVGGTVWAKATAVSNDSRRIYGVDADKHWLRGEVIEVLVSRPEGSRRASTLIRARYRVGEVDKDKILTLGQLKKDNPVEQAPAPVEQTTVAAAAPVAATVQASSGDGSSRETPDTTAPAASQAETTGTTASESTTGSNGRVPVANCHGTQWFIDPNTELPVNGTFV